MSVLVAYFYEVRHDEPAGRRVVVVERCECSRGGRTGELCSRSMEGKRRGKEVGRVAACLPAAAEKLMRTQCKQNTPALSAKNALIVFE